jgi:hypothetical protein
MATIIAGEFATMAETESVAAALKAADFEADNFSVFMLNAPGQHGLYPIGGDENADSGASHAHGGAVSGAIIGATVGLGVGAATMAATDAGPAVAATIAAAGAYTGSLVGALNKVGNDEAPVAATESARHAGAMVAINSIGENSVGHAIAILREHGARQIEQAEGRWENGSWLDFDPRVMPNLFDAESSSRVLERAGRVSANRQ